MSHRSISALAAFFLSFALIAFVPSCRAADKGDAFFGYTRTGNDTFYPNVGGLNGWDAALHVKLHPFLGAEGDISHFGLGASASTPRTTTYLFGPRVTIGAARVKIFAHGLVGGQHSSSSTGADSNSLTFALGGGIDLPIAPFFAWRIAGDYLNAPTRLPADGTPARFSTGLVFRF
jgi:hypothetical protein